MGKIGRNSPCPCGSGEKYKKCCLPKHEEQRCQQLSRSNLPIEERFEDLPDQNIEQDEDFGDVSVKEPAELAREPVTHEKPDLTLPNLSNEKQQIVNRWWEEFRPYYKERHIDEMISRITLFMEEHPDLFAHLYLHEECLFELGAELGRREEWSRYAKLLMRIRKEHPEMYVHSFGYYDRDVIAELALTGRRREIPDYFPFFKRYPTSHPDELSKIINLLAAAGFDEELFELTHAVAVPVWESPDVIGGGFVMRWLTFEYYVPYLTKKEYSDTAISQLIEDLQPLEILRYSRFNPEIAKHELECSANGPRSWDIRGCTTERDVRLFYHYVGWGLCGFLHDRKRLSWVTSRFLADLIEEFFTDIPPGKRPKKAFDFNETHVEKYMVKRYQSFFWVDGVQSMSLLLSFWYFTDYILEHRMIEDSAAEQNKQTCMHLLELCKKAVDSTDHGPRLYNSFPEMRFPLLVPSSVRNTEFRE